MSCLIWPLYCQCFFGLRRLITVFKDLEQNYRNLAQVMLHRCSTPTWFIWYIYYCNLQFLKNVILIKDKIHLPWVNVADFCYPINALRWWGACYSSLCLFGMRWIAIFIWNIFLCCLFAICMISIFIWKVYVCCLFEMCMLSWLICDVYDCWLIDWYLTPMLAVFQLYRGLCLLK